MELLDEPLDDSDTNTLGLSAQDLRDPAAIVSLLSITYSISITPVFSSVSFAVYVLCKTSHCVCRL